MLYSSKPEFIYFFDPDLDIRTKIGTSNQKLCIRIGFFENEKVILINYSTLYFNLFLIIWFCLVLLLILDTKILQWHINLQLFKLFKNIILFNKIRLLRGITLWLRVTFRSLSTSQVLLFYSPFSAFRCAQCLPT